MTSSELPPFQNTLARAAAGLSFSVFGAFVVRGNGQPLARLSEGKLAALLAYLAVEPGLHRRDALVELFWPDLATEAGRLNLRQALFQLRKTLRAHRADAHSGDALIVAGRNTVQLASDSPFSASVVEFARPLPPLLPRCTQPEPAHCAACLTRLAALADLYQGPLLADLSLPAAPAFEEWLQVKRETLHQQALELLVRLADCHTRRGDVRSALPFAQRFVALEPWSEPGQLRVMQLLIQDADYPAALEQYEQCRHRLERELGVAPNKALQTLAEQARTELQAMAQQAGAVAPPVEERRQVTVLYCELRLPGIEEPEEALALLGEPQARGEQLVGEHGGHVVRTYNGGFLAYFGYPRAVENAAVRAVQAAAALAALSATGSPSPVTVRVGVHSGLVLASPAKGLPDALGMTSTLAIRLHNLASDGEVVVSDATQQRAHGYFHFGECGSLHGALQGQGLTKGLAAFRLIAESGARHRLAAAAQLSPMVGREAETAALFRVWSQVRRGKLKTLLLHGEAGIGKSRLVNELVRRLGRGAAVVRELRCFQETMQSPYAPIIAFFATLSGFAVQDSGEERLTKLEGLLHRRAPQLAERALPLLAHLLDVPANAPLRPDVPTPLLSAETAALLVDLLLSLADQHSVLLVVEDLHWADASTLEVLAKFQACCASSPILMLMTARTDWWQTSLPAWISGPGMALAPLADVEAARLIQSLCPDIPQELVQRIVALADGVPLFVEELVAMSTIPANDTASAEGARCDPLPATLHDLLLARLDTLGPHRACAQLAATIGREFDFELLGEISGLAPEALRQSIKALLASGLVFAIEHQCFRFKHALVQEAAYQSQTLAARKLAHRTLARALEIRNQSAEHGKVPPEILAQHWDAAGEAVRAAASWLEAGQQTTRRFAHHEAIAHYEAGLRALEKTPTGIARDEQDFELLVGLSQSVQAVSGYGHGRSTKLLDRAAALANRGVGSRTALFQTIWGLWEGAGSRVDQREAVLLARQMLAIAETNKDTELLQQAHYALGNSLFWTGAFTESHAHLEAALAQVGTHAEPLRDYYGCIVVIGIKVYLSWVLWMQGHSGEAMQQGEEALALGRRYGDDYSLAFALTFAAILLRWQGRVEESLCMATEGLQVAQRCESAVFAAALTMTRGWAEVMLGQRASVTQIEAGITAIRTAMSAVVVPLLAPFAEALLHLGEVEKALGIVDEALKQSQSKHDRHYLAELHRMKGLCLQAKGHPRKAEAHYREALAIAQEQGAAVFEKRAQECLASRN